MSKVRDISGLANIIKTDANGNVTFVSGSTTLMAISSSGAITTTGVISGSNALSASYAETASFVTLSQTASFVANAQSASNAVAAQTASFVANAQSASNAVAAATASFANAFIVASTLTAQTLVVQTITSSVDFVTGSTRFGSLAANTHVFTGSMSVSGSVGIGVSSPNNTLNVRGDNGTSTAAVLRLRDTNTTARTTRLQFEDYTGALADGLIDFRIGTAGNASTATLSIGINSAGLTFNNSNAATFSNNLTLTNSVFPVLSVIGTASSPHIGSTWTVSANQDGVGRTIIGTAGQGRAMYFENNGNIVIPNNSLSVAGRITGTNISQISATGTGSPQSLGLSINAGSGGRAYLLSASAQWDANLSTSGDLYLIRCGYNNDLFTATFIAGTHNMASFTQSGGILYVTYPLNYAYHIQVLNNQS